MTERFSGGSRGDGDNSKSDGSVGPAGIHIEMDCGDTHSADDGYFIDGSRSALDGIASDSVDPEVDLEDPIDPGDPEDPVDPENLVNPEDPVEAGDLIDLEDTIDPEDPVEPRDPGDPEDRVEPEDPVDPGNPIELVSERLFPCVYCDGMYGTHAQWLDHALLYHVDHVQRDPHRKDGIRRKCPHCASQHYRSDGLLR